MKKVLLVALFGVASAATPARAQSPAQAPSPQVIAMLEMIEARARSQDVPPAVAPSLLAQSAPAQPAPPARPVQAPAPRPASAPAAPRPAPPAPAAPSAPPAQAAPVPAPPPPPPLRAAVNVRFDVTITDSGGPKPVTKTLSLTVSSTNSNGSVRSTAKMPGIDPNTPFAAPPTPDGKPSTFMPVPLNVDVRGVTWVDTSNAVRATVTIEYQPYIPEAKSQPGVISASSTSLFYDGRRTQILVASDPVSDRKTTIEVTATILK